MDLTREAEILWHDLVGDRGDIKRILAAFTALVLPDGALLRTHVCDDTHQWIAVIENAGIRDAHEHLMPPVTMMSQGSTRDEAIRSCLSALTLTISVLHQQLADAEARVRVLEGALQAALRAQQETP